MEFCTLVVLITFVTQSRAFFSDKNKEEIRCAVCRAMVLEINHLIESVDPKKTIDVAGYRLDGDGNQATKSVLYARSAIHLTEVMDGVCRGLDKYGVANLKNLKKSLVRTLTETKPSESIALRNTQKSEAHDRMIKHMCDDTVSDYDEDIMDLYVATNKPLDAMEHAICSSKLTGRCTDETLAETFPPTDDQFTDEPLTVKDVVPGYGESEDEGGEGENEKVEKGEDDGTETKKNEQDKGEVEESIEDIEEDTEHRRENEDKPHIDDNLKEDVILKPTSDKTEL